MEKVFFLFVILFSLNPLMIAQQQLDIEGHSSSHHVAFIKVNYFDIANGTGLAINAQPSDELLERGYGLVSQAGSVGVQGLTHLGTGMLGNSDSGTGVYGSSSSERGVRGFSSSSIGVWGSSNSGTGAYFRGGGGVGIEIEGVSSLWGGGSDDCVIRTDASDVGSDMIMVCNDVFAIHLDDDNNSTSTFFIANGGNNTILSLNESGDLSLTGSTLIFPC